MLINLIKELAILSFRRCNGVSLLHVCSSVDGVLGS